jgi:hypothetical protein
MKLRKGYVSNSSSSSFIVSIPKGKENDFFIKVPVNLESYATHIIDTKEELDKEFTYRLEYWGNKEYVETNYNKCLEAINRGERVLLGDFDSDSTDPVEHFLCDNGIGKQDNINVIENEAGY